MKNMTQKEFASLGGIARAKKLTPTQRKKIARKAGQGNKGKKKWKFDIKPSSVFE